ncbi:hypothetical protein BCR32DRAFT_295133 [Anaeromyces robustus]|uniref:DUF4832 domain-containing protein n=1 Tax=Anaeromyces robustus TaxID=1754192 RepID=A0A1Y1WY25_9FUNG|nr:hypothetical protein BCR32DRAFT_295133 [Anaeromyces robustus]|eukprot:ORX78285.1 hypothetical protein BCR32DRAFT_295133 [Anaeromyces robustus]
MKFLSIIFLASLLFNNNNIEVKGKPTNDVVPSNFDLDNLDVTNVLVKKSNMNLNLQSVNYISYEESLNEFNNPYRGFFKQLRVKLTPSGGSASSLPKTNLIRVLVDLSEFSKVKNHSKDYELTDKALTILENVLKLFKSNQRTAVIRFAYHPDYSSSNHTYEPSMDTILKHQEKLGKLLTNYSDIIAVVECGLLGMYGEMHSSYVYEDKTLFSQNASKIIEKWLEVLPPSITISVRKPKFYCDWKGIDIKNIDKDTSTSNKKASRIGLYNDGYFASDSDLGTYKDRTKEVKWLTSQAKHTLFGGEFGRPDSTFKIDLNTLLSEIFLTHTSYLNLGFYEGTIDKLKNTKYSLSDKKYKGQSGMVYVQNHLGYRFVVKSVSITKIISKNESFGLMVKIANVGFANLIKPKESIIILKNTSSNTNYKFPLMYDNTLQMDVLENVNPNNWESNTENIFKVSFKLPNNVSVGNYKVYLRLASDKDSSGNNGYPIRFVNEGNNIWDSTLGANYLADLTITNTNNSNYSNNSNPSSNNVKTYVPPKPTSTITKKPSYTPLAYPKTKTNYINIKFKGTLKNKVNYYLGVRQLGIYNYFNIVNEYDSAKSVKYRTWHVTSLTEPSFIYLSDGTYGNPGNPTNYCLDLSIYGTSQGYNYLSIVECSKAKYKFKYGGTYSDTIDIYNRNNQHIIDKNGNKLCLFYSTTPRISRCEKHYKYIFLNKSNNDILNRILGANLTNINNNINNNIYNNNNNNSDNNKRNNSIKNGKYCVLRVTPLIKPS